MLANLSGATAACLASFALLGPDVLAAGACEMPTFRNESGRFSVRLPDAMKREQEHRSAYGPTTTGTAFRLARGDSEYRVQYFDLPRLSAALLPDRFILQRAMSRLVEHESGRMLLQRDLLLQGYAALIVTYAISADGGSLKRALLVLADRRLYIASTRWSVSQPDVETGEQFFGSFVVWEADGS